jgi:hypothetical protein
MGGAVGFESVGTDLEFFGVDVDGNDRRTGMTKESTDRGTDSTATGTHHHDR